MSSHRKLALICFLVFVSIANAHVCSKPSVRREWSSISESERTDWINAVKCLSKLPHDNSLTPSVDPALSLIPPINTSSSYYDDLVYEHMDLNIKIHFTGLFLPWHRGYVHAFESALKQKCGYKGTQPYWNWSRDTENFFNSSIFDPSLTSGFGTNGDPNDNYQLVDGAFSTDFLRAYPAPNRVRRNFTRQPWEGLSNGPFSDDIPDPLLSRSTFANQTFNKQEVEKLVNGFKGDFRSFQAYFEGFRGAHAGVHAIINGDMFGTCPKNAASSCVWGPKWSPNDPIFFMHHSMVDKIWYDWQHKDKSNFWSFFGGSAQGLQNLTAYTDFPNGEPPFLNFHSTVPSDGLYEEYTIFDLMDTTAGPLCYVYA